MEVEDVEVAGFIRGRMFKKKKQGLAERDEMGTNKKRLSRKQAIAGTNRQELLFLFPNSFTKKKSSAQ